MEKAIELLRKEGKKTMEKRAGRDTSSGASPSLPISPAGVGTMIDLRCESAPVANQRGVRPVGQRPGPAIGHGPRRRRRPRSFWRRSRPASPAHTLKQQFDDLNNRIREVFRLERLVRINGVCGGYAHHNGAVGVLLQVEGGNAELAKDICMHVAAMRPTVVGKEDLDPAVVAKEREILAEAARGRQAGKDHRQDGRRPAAELLRRTLPVGAALRQGRQADRRPGGQGSRHEDHSFRPLGDFPRNSGHGRAQEAAVVPAQSAGAWC